MKCIFALLTIFLLTLGTPHVAPAQASGHGDHGTTASNPGHVHDGGHEGMQMETGGSMAMLGTVTTDGIKAMAHLQDLHPGAVRNAADVTHNFMVAFESQDQGGMVTQGRVAVKVTGPDGNTGSAIALNARNGFFSVDVSLPVPGKYIFLVGTKLADEKTRQFRFSHEIK